MPTDFSNVFNPKVDTPIFTNPTGIDDKYQQLQQASENKIQDLANRAALQAAAEEVRKQSLVGKLGLDPNSITSDAVNLYSEFVSGGARVAGQLASEPFSNKVAIAESQIDPVDMGALTRHAQGKATKTDLELINRRIPTIRNPDINSEQADTPLKLWNEMNAARTTSRNITKELDFSKMVDTTKRDVFTKALTQNYNNFESQGKEGVAKLLFDTFEAVGSNKRAALGYIVENIPQLALAAFGKGGKSLLTASNAGYAFDNYNEGIQNYQAKHNGALPPVEERQRMAVQSAGLLALEQGSDLLTLGATKLLGKAAADATRATFKSALKGTTEAGVRGTVGESITEGAQTYLEGEITGKPATGAEIYTGTVIGGVSGGTLAGGGRGLHEASTLASQPVLDKPITDTTVPSPSQADAIKLAIETGDTTDLLNPDSINYAPAHAVRALFGHSQLETTTPEIKEENLVKANQIISDIQDNKEAIKMNLSTLEDRRAVIDSLKERQAKVDPSNTTRIEQFQAAIDLHEETYSDAEKNPLSQDEILKGNSEINKLDRLLKDATIAKDELQQLVQPPKAIEEIVKQADITTETNIDHPPAIDKVIKLAMASPDRLSADQATQLANNTNNGLTESHRKYLREFSAARLAENQLMTMGDVSQDILVGKKNKGIAQYRAALGNAISIGNKKAAVNEINGIQKFASSHQSKAETAVAALAQGLGTQIINDGKGNWSINTKPMSIPELRKNGGLAITSAGLVNNIQTESEVLFKSLAEMKSAYDMKFNPIKQEVKQNQPTDLKSDEEVTNGTAPQSTNSTLDTESTKSPSNNTTRSNTNGILRHDIATESRRDGLPRTTMDNIRSSGVILDAGKQSNNLKNSIGGVDGSVQVDGRVEGETQDTIENSQEQDQNKEQVFNDPTRQSGEQSSQTTEKVTEDNTGIKLKDGSVITINSIPSPKSFSNLTRMEFGEPLTLIATNSNGEEVGRLTYMPNGGPIDVFVKESERRKGIGNALYTALENAGGKLMPIESDVVISDDARALRASRSKVETTPVVESNKLVAMEQKSPENTAYKSRNLLSDYFTQTINNTFNKAPQDIELNDKQTALINLFNTKVSEWSNKITSNLKPGSNPEYYYKDLTQFLIKDGDVEQQVKEAIVYAAFNWLMSTVTRPRYNGQEEINAILKRDENTLISKEEEAILGDVGANQNAVISSMGQVPVKALGIKPSKDTKSNLPGQLDAHMGAHVFKLLLDLGIVERNVVSGEDMARLTQNDKTDKNASFPFIKLVYEKDELPAQTKEILDTVRGTQGILDKMFSVESSLKEPSFKPIKYTQVFVKGTKQLVAKKMKKVLQDENSVASYVHPGIWNFISIVSNDTLLEINGAEDIESKHTSNQPGIKSLNDSIQRGINNFKDFVGDMLDLKTPMYFDHVMWKPQRVGISTNLINPQTNKFHRNSLYRKEWDSTIDRSNSEQMQSFFLRVGEGLGVKTDKKGNDKSIETIKSLLPTVAPGVDALVYMLQHQDITTMSQEHQEAVTTAVKVGGENMHSLASLMALAQYKVAKLNDEQTFNVQLMGEVDGVTNGPMIAHLLLGAAQDSEQLFTVLNKGGFFEVGNEHQQYNLWREAEGHFDLYETTAGHMVKAIQNYINKGITNSFGKVVLPGRHVAFIMPSIYAFTGELADKNGTVKKDGRNIIKTPLTAMMFGSSIGNTINSMAEKFVESIYGKIEDTAAGKEKSMKTSELITHINNLFVLNSAPKLSETLSISELMNTPFTNDQLDAIKKTFKDTLGQAVKSTMEEDFAIFIARRKQFNQSAQLTHEIYNSVYMALHEQLLTEEMSAYANDNSQGIAFTWGTVNGEKVRQPLHDLSIEQIESIHKQLESIAPVMHTYMSQDSGDINAGLYIGKNDIQLSERPTYAGEIKFGTTIPGTKVWSKSKNTYVEQSGLSVNAYEDVTSSPGVAMVPMSMHSSDSAIMHNSLGKSGALNIHDAKGVGINGFQEAANSLNTSTWNVMLNYSPANEIYKTLINIISGLAVMVEQKTLPNAALENLIKSLKIIAEKDKDGIQFRPDMLLDLVTNMKNTSYQADKIKLKVMSKMAYVDQYALQGGNYEVTESDRQEAATKLNELTKDIDNKTLKSIEILKKHLNFSNQPKVESKPIIEEDQTIVEPVKPNSSLKLGEPRIASDKTLVDFFTQNPETNAKRVLEGLISKYKQNPNTSNAEFNLMLSKMLMKAIDPGLRIHFVTAQTQDQDIIGGPVPNARGWYSIYGSEDNIYVLSPEFIDSGLTPETLLHELTHASITRLIRSNNPDIKQYVDDLKDLLSLAQKYIKDNNLQKYNSVLSNSDDSINLDEMIAWGMTNQKFQQEVLSKIIIVTKSKPLNGLQEFIKNITGILFGKWSNKPAVNNGMSLLISNVTSLIAMSSEQIKSIDSTEDITLSMTNTVDSYTTLDIFDSINNNTLDPTFQDQLRELLNGMVTKLHGPFGAFKESMRKNEAGNPLSVWLKAIDTGKAPFASRILASGFTGNNQQDFVMEQVEATVRAALDGNDIYKDLTALYEETHERIQPQDFLGGDFNTNTMDEAQALYDFVFTLEKSNGNRSDYLARFAALGLAHQGFNKLLKVATKTNNKVKVTSFVERLQKIVENILEFFHSKITHTYQGQNADIKLTILVEQLVDIEAKKRHTLKQRAAGGISVMDTIETKTRIFTDVVLDKTVSVLNSPKLRKNANAFVRATTQGASTILGGRLDQFLQTMTDLRDKEFKGQLGIVAGLINNLKGPIEVYKELLLNSKQVEKKRVQEIAHKSKFVTESFINQGMDLTEQAKKSISVVFLRTGAHNLLPQLSLTEIETLLDSRKTLDTKITDLEARINIPFNLKKDILHDADGLAYYKATGVNRLTMLKQNVYQIVNRFGEANKGNINAQDKQSITDILNILVPLYAIRHLSEDTVKVAKDVLNKENTRTDGNGIEFTLELHKYLEQQSQEKLFNSNPALMTHGYTPEIYNYRTLITTSNAIDGKELINMGYSEGSVVPKDPADPNQEKVRLYKLADGGLSPHVTGIVGYGNNKARGTKVDDMLANTAAITKHRQQSQANHNKKRDFAKQSATYAAPVFNELGDIVSWRYLMSENTKDTLLERNNSFDTLLGSLAGSIQGKVSTIEQNKIAMTAALEQYEKEFATKGASYVLVGPKSDDPELRSIWALLPEQTKQDVKTIWDREGLMVRKDALDIMFGYHKLSAVSMFDKANKERKADRDLGLMTNLTDLTSINVVEKVIIGVVEGLLEQYAIHKLGKTPLEAQSYALKAAAYAAKAENIWQAIVTETKDIIVVKTGMVLVGNIVSNFSMLYLQGVSIADMVKYTLVAFKGATAYKADTEELDKLRTLVKTGYTQGQTTIIARRITVLEDAIERNPVRELIEAGLMPTIVEDLDAEEDIYSYKSIFTKKVEKVTDKLNPTLVKGLRGVYMTHDTKMYRGLSHITQMSDFVARYTLFQHQTTRKKNPLSKKEAIIRASDAFVNYDIPMHRGLQYSDDMGITMFTKYFLYIQHELIRLAKENPLRVYSTLLLNNFHELGTIVLDSSIYGKIGNNPIRAGAFAYPGVLDKLATVNSALAIIK